MGRHLHGIFHNRATAVLEGMMLHPPRQWFDTRLAVLACVLFVALLLSERTVFAQGRDGLLNGAAMGAAVGAGVGVVFTHAVRDSDLVFSQYARGALVFGAIGAGVGLGVDALFNRASPVRGVPTPRVLIAPSHWRGVTGVVVRWRW